MSTRQTTWLTWPQGCWPNEEQGLLLKACLFPDERHAKQAFLAWSERVPFFCIDGGSHKLLLLLYERLKRWQLHYSELPRLRGLVRYYWVRHQQLQTKLIAALRLFREAGFDTLLLKGSALNATVYRDSARLMSDVDLAVPRDQAHRAIDLLLARGWKTKQVTPHEVVDTIHGCAFVDEDGYEVDLHWELFAGHHLTPDEQRGFWEAAEVVCLQGEPTRVLCPGDQLLQVCQHGARYNPFTPPFRWLADAQQILQITGASIDWSRTVELAQRYRIDYPLRETLQYLDQELGLELPAPARQELDCMESSWTSWTKHQLLSRRLPCEQLYWSAFPRLVLSYAGHPHLWERISLSDYLMWSVGSQPPFRRDIQTALRMHLAMACDQISAWGARLRQFYRSEHGTTFSVGRLPDHAVEGFSPIQRYQLHTYRWSEGVAAAQLPIQPGNYQVTVRFAPRQFDRDNLAKQLQVRWNRHLIPRESMTIDTDHISFGIEPAWFESYPLQRLELRHSEGRRAGLDLPVAQIQFCPQAT